MSIKYYQKKLCHNRKQKIEKLVMEPYPRKEETLTVRLTRDEKIKIASIAKQNNLTISKLARSIILESIDKADYQDLIEIKQKTYFLLGKITVLLRSLDNSAEEIHSINELINQVRRELIKIEQ
jgi:hypothetical protein